MELCWVGRKLSVVQPLRVKLSACLMALEELAGLGERSVFLVLEEDEKAGTGLLWCVQALENSRLDAWGVDYLARR